MGKEIPETSKDSKVKMVNLVSHFHRLLMVSIQRVMAGRYSGITYSSYTPPTWWVLFLTLNLCDKTSLQILERTYHTLQ